ncbi:hypothetical protein Misp01_29140 [Microtetraspora sp. NBRC 13810]|uniref:hypothetical protein n=1 Tax=Microtetraspora sp. NBRC 13810 TaxID=3030990 RepID=UPI0024A3E209|nr:hypothetical protein [Microtetraspora sp. NBRC 13810]GLW07784.1 hypothetical protein Misp01_29140 [Microtetraspora sp. NBRC 13810]
MVYAVAGSFALSADEWQVLDSLVDWEKDKIIKPPPTWKISIGGKQYDLGVGAQLVGQSSDGGAFIRWSRENQYLAIGAYLDSSDPNGDAVSRRLEVCMDDLDALL